MILNSQQASTFRETLRGLSLLNDETVDEILQLSAQTGRSPVEILGQRGIVAPQDIEVVDLLLRADEAIPGYELINLVGRGGMGVVYRARQKNLNRYVALKTILANHATDKTALARFEREAVTIAQLAHPNIVCALDFGRHHGRLYLAMEIVEGEDLNNYIQRQVRLAESTAWGIARQVAGGLLHASKAGVIHRDIKPANILLVNPPEGYPLRPGLPMAKISDFGLAILNSQQAVSERLTSRDSALGSPHYMAPEQLSGEDCDTRADIYALGATVFHMLAGKPPWSGKSLQQIIGAKFGGQRPQLAEFCPTVSSESSALIANMLEPDPRRRIDDYSQLMSAMDSLVDSLVPARAVPLLDRHSTRKVLDPDATPLSLSLETAEAMLDAAPNSSTPVIANEPTAAPVRAATRTLPRKHWSIAAAVGATLIVAATIYFTGRVGDPVRMVATTVQKQLFNGKDLLDRSIKHRIGGWAVRDGRLVHEEGAFGYLTFAMPDWEYFSFEVNVESNPTSAVFVHFARQDDRDQGLRQALRIIGNRAELGSLAEVRGRFDAVGPAIELDADRSAHAIKLQREVDRWFVEVDGRLIGTSLANSRQLSLITLAVEKMNPSPESDSNTTPSSITLAEIVATQLKPAQ